MEKLARYLLLSLGMGIGSYAPALFGASIVSIWGLIGAAIGGFVAIYCMRYYDI